MYCKKCGAPNSNDANFCESCGTQLSKTKTAHNNKKRTGARFRNAKRESSISVKSLWIGAVVFVAGLLIYSIVDTNFSRDYTASNAINNFNTGSPAVEAKVYEIASKFVCGCGSCGEESLEVCDCNFAIQEKQLIRTLVQNSTADADIFNAVSKKYGGIKSDISVDKSLKSSTFNTPGSNIKLAATFNDRVEIYSQFECPCGQCGVDELKDCTCNHKNGAIEVKSYIDSQIALNLYSVDEIVSQVASKYGGKKL